MGGNGLGKSVGKGGCCDMAAEIFIIGADDATGGMLENVLEAVGYKVQAFIGFPEAIESLSPTGTHLVFIDTASAGHDLEDEIEAIQRVVPNIEIILIADYQDPLIEDDARRHHIGIWLYRPFTPPEVILKVFGALEGASSVGADGLPIQPAPSEDHLRAQKQNPDQTQ